MNRLSACLLISILCSCSNMTFAQSIKVAFTGDQSIGSGAEEVLRLIRDEGSDLLLIQGDLGYNRDSAWTWNSHLDDILGEDFPVLAVVGNHENFEWLSYKSYLQRRLDRIGELGCIGDTGVKATCQFGNLEIVQVASGIKEVNGVLPEDGYEEFIRNSFAERSDNWRICTWHKNQNALQTGRKEDATGWGIYDACLDAGAMVIVAHEHAYSRSYLLSDFSTQNVIHQNSEMTLKPGQSFVAVSGLGGREVRAQVRGGDWWASVYTATQNATFGALFCTFESSTADCYFKAVNGDIPDRFTLIRGDSSSNDGFVFSRTDKDEFRWIASGGDSGLGNVWIDENCAQRLGGPVAYGDWGDLDELAPNHDSIGSPCAEPSENGGYVFSRTDKNEYRWIDRNASGQMGNTWIDGACADQLGGAEVWGDWGDLDDIAPAHDSIANPCDDNGMDPRDEGYVFSRTDKTELRWIDVNQSGGMGSTWIDEDCAASLGGPSAYGDWEELIAQAPDFDTVAYPCN